MQKRLAQNRKAQGGMSLEVVVGVVILLIVAVIVIVFVTGGFDYLSDKFKTAPGQNLQAQVEACKISGQNNLQIDYCSFKELKIDGKTQFVNCDDPRVLAANSGEIENPPNCATLGASYMAKTYCGSLTNNADKIVNNQKCSEWTAIASTCQGTAKTCSSITTGEACTKQDGCTWDTQSTPNVCKGIVKACNTFTAEIECREQQGCSWI